MLERAVIIAAALIAISTSSAALAGIATASFSLSFEIQAGSARFGDENSLPGSYDLALSSSTENEDMSLSAPPPGAPSASSFSSSSVVGSVTLLAALDLAADSTNTPPGAALATGNAIGSLAVFNVSSSAIEITAILSWGYLLELETFAPAGDPARYVLSLGIEATDPDFDATFFQDLTLNNEIGSVENSDAVTGFSKTLILSPGEGLALGFGAGAGALAERTEPSAISGPAALPLLLGGLGLIAAVGKAGRRSSACVPTIAPGSLRP